MLHRIHGLALPRFVLCLLPGYAWPWFGVSMDFLCSRLAG